MDKKLFMKTVVEWREKLYSYYIAYEKYIKILVKFLMVVIALYMVTNQLHYQNKLSKLWVVIGVSLVATCLPYSVITLLVVLTAILQIYFLSPVLAGLTAIIAFVLYLMLIRYDHKSMIASVFVPIFILWKMPFVLALVLGLLFGPVSILTAASGVIMYYALHAVTNMQVESQSNVTDLFTVARTFLDAIVKNKSMYVMLVVMVAVVFVTWFIRTRKMNYAFEISILAGTVCGFFILLVGNLIYKSEFSVVWLFLGSLLSGIIGYVVHFMHMVLDYGKTEEVQFDDDDYYYYVRAVPKLKVNNTRRKVTSTNRQVSKTNSGRQVGNNRENTRSRRPSGKSTSSRNRK